MKMKAIAIVALVCLSGCGSALQSKPIEVAALSKNQGVIVGSIILKLQDKTPMLPMALSEKQWHAIVWPDGNRFLEKLFPPTGKVLDIKPDGKEIPFVSVLTAGKYKFESLGTSGTDPNYRVPLHLKFTVEENKKTYIGRLVITIPSHVGVLDGLLDTVLNTKRRTFSVAIEDAQEDTVKVLSEEFGISLAEGLQKGLMATR